MSTIRRVVKNTSVLTIAQVIGYVLSFIYILYLARYLGPSQYGVLSFAIAFTGFFQFFADMGLQTLLVREIARDKSRIAKYVANIGLVKLILAILAFIAMAAVINVMAYPAESVQVVYVIGLAVVINALSLLYLAIFQATESMEIQGLGQICYSLFIFGGILVGINLGFDIEGFSYVYLFSSILIFVYYTVVINAKYLRNRLYSNKVEIDPKFCWGMIVEALPFGLAGIFSSIYFTIDSVLLSAIKGNEAVGLYGAAYRIVQVITFIPIVWGVSIFPIMAKYYITSKDSLKFVLGESFKYLTIIVIPLAVGVTILSSKIVVLLYGSQFSPSVISLQILIWATIFLFMDYPFAMLTLAVNKQKVHTLIMATCAIVNVILNLIFIPVYGAVAAATVLLATQLTAFVLHYIFSRKIGYSLGAKKVFGLVTRIVVASLLMGAFIICLGNISLLLLIPAAVAMYILLMFITGGLNRDDLMLIANALKRN